MTQTSNTTMGLCIKGKFDGCHDGLMFRVETSLPFNPYASKVPMILSTSLKQVQNGISKSHHED
jgi:hypothetical protein